MNSAIETAIQRFRSHYDDRLGSVSVITPETPGFKHTVLFDHSDLKADNGPRIFHHGDKTADVIVLTHGYTDSPYYLQAVARRFYEAGLNVVMPLLPAHGLKNPGEALQDKSLDSQWKNTIDNAIETAAFLGDRLSIGGFSTGGALSINKVLRDESGLISGGLFLFSAAIGLGDLNEAASKLGFLQTIIKLIEGETKGEGRDPYKYPEMSATGGIEVGNIVNENNRRLDGGKEKTRVKIPVFAAHSAHDKTARLGGLISFMEDHVDNGASVIISESVEHACLPLEKDILLNDQYNNELSYPPVANPKFGWMMESTLSFFEREVRKV